VLTNKNSKLKEKNSIQHWINNNYGFLLSKIAKNSQPICIVVSVKLQNPDGTEISDTMHTRKRQL
jgi:FixJ family two-component response regulator